MRLLFSILLQLVIRVIPSDMYKYLSWYLTPATHVNCLWKKQINQTDNSNAKSNYNSQKWVYYVIFNFKCKCYSDEIFLHLILTWFVEVWDLLLADILDKFLSSWSLLILLIYSSICHLLLIKFSYIKTLHVNVNKCNMKITITFTSESEHIKHYLSMHKNGPISS